MTCNSLEYAAHIGTFCYWIILNKFEAKLHINLIWSEIRYWLNLKWNCVLIKFEAKLRIYSNSKRNYVFIQIRSEIAYLFKFKIIYVTLHSHDVGFTLNSC